MKKFRNLKFFGLVAVLTFALVFIGINFVQGQVKIQKGKPPHAGPNKEKYVWSAVILDGQEFGLKGVADDIERYDGDWPGWVYDDSESNVSVGVEIRRAPFGGVDKYWTRFYLEILYPVQIDFDFIPYNAWFYPDTPDALCKYPGCDGYLGCDGVKNPFCMFDFMQNCLHPHPDYHKVRFGFATDRSVNQNEIDYEQWTYHEHMGFISNISGPAPSAFKPVTCEDLDLFEFSNIEFGGGDYGYFERIEEDYENIDIWKVVVGMEKDPFYDYTILLGDEDDAWATDWYNICVEMQYNKKKKGSTYDSIFSSQGSLDVKFEILFIRTKIIK